MSSEATCPITLTVAGDPRLARLVRMTAANVGALCSMSVDRIDEDDQATVYAELILASVCDSYEKTAAPLTLSLDLKADI